jgi:predicted NUDIX family NTP pyrophosphohydrolase
VPPEGFRRIAARFGDNRLVAARISAGVLLYRRAGEQLEVLLAHPGGPYFVRRDAGYWTIPKGEVDPGEELLDVARREFEEETGQRPPDGPIVELGSIVQKGGKVVHAWAIEGDVDPATTTSNTFEIEWPPRSGNRQAFPEVDRVEWFAPVEARKRIKSTQIPLIDRLEAALSG